MPELPYEAICLKCGHIFRAGRKPRREKSCGYCHPTFSRDRVLEYRRVGEKTREK